MKKIISLLILIHLFSINVFAYEPISREDKINIYSIAIDTLISYYDNLEDIDYIAIDMNNKFFEQLDKADKEKILNNLKKYNKTMMNRSLKDLNQGGFTDNFNRLNGNSKNGLLINIVDYKYKNDKIFIEGAIYTDPISAKGVKIVINEKDDQWNLERRRVLWGA